MWAKTDDVMQDVPMRSSCGHISNGNTERSLVPTGVKRKTLNSVKETISFRRQAMGLCLFLGMLLWITGAPMNRVDASSHALHHPQVKFCSAGFVLRAVVRDSDVKSNTYDVKVLDLFKDEVDLSRAEGTRFLRNRLKLKLYSSPYNVPLHVGKVYILAGQLQNRKLQMNMGDWIFPLVRPTGNEWKDVSPTQREGLYFHYKRGCKCRIGICYGDPNCSQKVSGCEYSALEKRPPFDVCRMKHQLCEMKEDQGVTRCHWKSRATDEFKDCERNP